MPLNLPKRCPNCARRVVKTASGSWLCDPVPGGCGWTDDPRVLQPLQTVQTAESPREA